MIYIVYLLTIALLIMLGLTSAANGAGPVGLAPVQRPLKLAADPLRPVIGIFGIIAVIWGVWGVIFFFVAIDLLSVSPLRTLLTLLCYLVLVTVAVLAAYPSVAAFFGAPASGAGRFIDGIKRTFSANEAIVGLVALALGLWKLVELILVASKVWLPI